MSAADPLAAWRERAEAELGGPLRSLTPRRFDDLSIAALEVADPLRERGLGSGPGRRAVALVTDERAHALTPEGRDLLDGVDVLWFRGDRSPSASCAVVIEPTAPDFDRASLGDALVLSDAATERVVSAGPRAWDPRDAVGSIGLHERGASAVTQVALAVAAMLDRRRALGSARPPAFASAVSPEIFVELGKLRALRRLSDRLLATLGEPLGVPLYVRTDVRSLSRLDRATNAIRSTLGVAAAMFAGADCVGAVAMDALTDASAPGARLSRNAALVLALESSLTATDDPARGSYYVEALTDRIAREAWELVREIERRGGLTRAAGWARERVDAEASARHAAVRSRALPLVGVSRFAVQSEVVPPGPDTDRDATPFEALHAAGRAAVALVVLGERAAVEARVAFARELIEVGAMEVVDAPPTGEVTARVALIAAPDALFATEVAACVSALHGRGVAVWVAGRPGAHEAALRAAGVHGFVFVGADVVDALTAMREHAAGRA